MAILWIFLHTIRRFSKTAKQDIVVVCNAYVSSQGVAARYLLPVCLSWSASVCSVFFNDDVTSHNPVLLLLTLTCSNTAPCGCRKNMATDAEMQHPLSTAAQRVHKLGRLRYGGRLRGSCVMLSAAFILVIVLSVAVMSSRPTHNSQRLQVSTDLLTVSYCTLLDLVNE